MRRLGSLSAALLAVAVACEGTVAPPPAASPGPIGAAAYAARLRDQAELDWTPDQVSRVARAEARFVRERMDRLAERMGDRDGRSAMERLSRDRPASEADILAAYRQQVERARRFVEEHGLVTVPPGPPLAVVATAQVSGTGRYPLVAYLGDKLAVTVGADLSEAVLGQHCRACIPPLVVHEAYPGHHLAFLVRRQAKPDPGPAVLALANRHAKNRFHGEGWASYGEVMMLEAGYYAGDPAGELAAWRLVLVRLLRAALDAELHAGRISDRQLVKALVEDAQVAPETAEAELRLHLEEPTQKASYALGMLQILALRAAVERQRPELDARAFHDTLLAWPLPWPEVARHGFGIAPPTVPDDGLTLARTFGAPAPTAARIGAP